MSVWAVHNAGMCEQRRGGHVGFTCVSVNELGRGVGTRWIGVGGGLYKSRCV